LNKTKRINFSAAEKTGALTLFLACAFFFVHPFLSLLPLVFFLFLCCIAPFCPGWSFYLPVISKGPAGAKSIALTFDDGPNPESTHIVLDLLARHKLQATFFVVGEKVAGYPELMKEIVAQGHTVGNHSWSHNYFLMLRSPKTIWQDIHRTQDELRKLGIEPQFFRPPIGITGPRLAKPLAQEHLVCVNYSRRALDRGNKNINNLAAKIDKKIKTGDIIMLHDLPVPKEEEIRHWQQELENLFTTLQRNYTIVPLEMLLQQSDE